MTTFTAITLENLIEPRARESLKNSNPEVPNTGNGRSRHLYISPALYTTPEQSPIPDYSSPYASSPSPYVANHKRRDGGHARVPEMRRCGDTTEGSVVEEMAENFVNYDVSGVPEEEVEGLLDLRSEVGSELDAADLSLIQFDSRSFVSAQGEFFDATDEFSFDGSISTSPSCEHGLESLHALRLNLLEEIEKRKAAEETLLLMLSQWEKIRILMSGAGITFPAPPAITDHNMKLEDQVMDKMSQEVVVAKYVAEAIGRGLARAEAEEAASAIVELKDLEIMRLRDRLQYFETVNHEMSQRKLVEVARRQQERKSRRRWLWSFTGMAIAIGASLAAYSYNSHTSEIPPSLESGDTADSSVFSSETS